MDIEILIETEIERRYREQLEWFQTHNNSDNLGLKAFPASACCRIHALISVTRRTLVNTSNPSIPPSEP
jgi:hypothetical protein